MAVLPLSALVLLLGAGCDPYDPSSSAETPPNRHAISGEITPSHLGYLATAVLSGPVSATAAISSSGTFQFTDLPDGTYTVTPTASDRLFDPKSQTVILAGADVTLPSFGITGDWQQAVAKPTVDIPDYLGIWGSGMVDVFAVGTAGALAAWNGIGTYALTEGTETCRAIWFEAPGDAWKACDAGVVLFRGMFSGTYKPMTTGTTVTLRGVCCTSTDAWVVGDAGTILRGGSSGLARVPSGTTADLHAVVCSSAEVFAVGTGGTILHWNGAAWAAEDSGTTATLRGLALTPTAYAVGDAGTILRRSGTGWVHANSGTTADLHGVTLGATTAAGSGPIVVGAGGTILRPGRGGWVIEESHTTETLRGVWGSFAVGDRGTFLQRRVYGTP